MPSMAEEAACTPPVAKSSDRAVAHTLTAPGALVMQGPATSLLFLAVGLARVALHCSWLTGRHSCSGGGGKHQVGRQRNGQRSRGGTAVAPLQRLAARAKRMQASAAHLAVERVIQVHKAWLAPVAGEGKPCLAVNAGGTAGQVNDGGRCEAPSRCQSAGGWAGVVGARSPI